MELSVVLTLVLSGCHWLRRPFHGSLHLSWVDAVYPTLKLICDFWPSKFSHYPSRPVPLPEDFVTTRPDPVPKSKTTTRQSLLGGGVWGGNIHAFSGGLSANEWKYLNERDHKIYTVKKVVGYRANFFLLHGNWSRGHILTRECPRVPSGTPRKSGLSDWKRPKEGERVARGHFHERVGESPVHWLPPGVGFTQKPFSVSENGPIENFLRSNSIFI